MPVRAGHQEAGRDDRAAACPGSCSCGRSRPCRGGRAVDLRLEQPGTDRGQQPALGADHPAGKRSDRHADLVGLIEPVGLRADSIPGPVAASAASSPAAPGSPAPTRSSRSSAISVEWPIGQSSRPITITDMLGRSTSDPTPKVMQHLAGPQLADFGLAHVVGRRAHACRPPCFGGRLRATGASSVDVVQAAVVDDELHRGLDLPQRVQAGELLPSLQPGPVQQADGRALLRPVLPRRLGRRSASGRRWCSGPRPARGRPCSAVRPGTKSPTSGPSPISCRPLGNRLDGLLHVGIGRLDPGRPPRWR